MKLISPLRQRWFIHTHPPLLSSLLGGFLFLGCSQITLADFIPALDGDYAFFEEVVIDEYNGISHNIDKTYGESLTLAERISASGSATNDLVSPPISASASAWAETSVSGTAQAEVMGQFDDAGAANVSAVGRAEVSYGFNLIKLHPDAPDDPLIPLSFTSSLTSGGGFTGIEITNRFTGGVLFEYLDTEPEGTTLVNSSITVPVNVTIGVAVGARHGDGIARASAPVSAIDPNFLVPFGTNPDGSQRFERAIDLYTVSYPSQIGYAGDFATVTPLTDGCLPDPSILGPSGTQSVTGGETVTCRALDPSGFRSYAEGVQNPLGDLNNMSIVVTPDAIVRTVADETETVGILGSDNEVINYGSIDASGNGSTAVYFSYGNRNIVSNFGNITSTGTLSSSNVESHAIHIEGDQAGVHNTNQGFIATEGDYSAAIYLEGDEAGVLNEGLIVTNGFQSSAVVIEGDSGQMINHGEVQTTSDQSAALVNEGFFASIENTGNISTQGVFSAGIASLGISDIENSGHITTNGADAMGILALGPGHDISNTDSSTGNQIYTIGDRAHGIALGLQEPVLPVGVIIPPEALLPAAGSIDNAGPITTEGDEADAIHALADYLPLSNSGDLVTAGYAAHGINIEGSNAIIAHTGAIETNGEAAHGIVVDGNDATVNHGDETTFALIETYNRNATGILVLGDNAMITIGGGSTPAGIGTLGEYADAVAISGDAATILSKGELIVRGNNAVGITALGDDGQIDNLGSITAGLDATSSGNIGIDVLGDRNRVTNNKTVFVESNNSVGVYMQGNNAILANGDTQHQDAFIGVVGNNARAVHIESDAPIVVNEAELAADGDSVFGIYAVAGSGSTFQVTSGNLISVSGNNVVGMSIVTTGDLPSAVASGPAPACAVAPGSTSKFMNCGNIEILDSANGTGMLAVDVTNTAIENQKNIVGSGSGLRGIEVFADPLSNMADNQISNIDLIELSGKDSTGISLLGNGNSILHGTGSIAVPIVPLADPLQYIELDGSNLFVSGAILNITSDFDTANSGSPGANIPRGNISVTGPNAIGIAIDGSDNRVAITVNEDPNAGPGQDGLPTSVTASGTNSVGIKLSGQNNLLVNGGEIIADGIGVLGGNGSESIVNKQLISGGVQLNGGDDILIIENGSEIAGTADGGADHDILIVSTPKDIGKPAPPAYEVDGSKFVNFEKLEKVGAGDARLSGTLVVDDARLLQGDLQLASAYLQTASTTVTVEPGARLSGTGTIEGRVEVNGGTLAPGLNTGALSINGDLAMNGILELEALSLTDLDELIVDGNVDFSGGAIEVLLGYTPEQDEVINFMSVSGSFDIVSGFDNIIGIATAASDVTLGTEFTISLGGQLFNGIVTSAVPVPASVWLFGSGLVGMVAIARRRKKSR